MIHFKPIDITDQDLFSSYLYASEEKDCDFSFANLCSWHFLTESSYAIIEQFLVIRFVNQQGEHEYFMPLGTGNRQAVIEILQACAQQEQVPFCLRGIRPRIQEELEQYFPGQFEYISDRDYFDYIYLRQDLVELKGKNYQPKRNHVNKFQKEYRYSYQPLSPELIPDCLQFEATWCMRHGYIENENIRNERRALTYALHHFDALNLSGGVLFVEDRLAAFTFGTPINHNTFGIHFEKADIHIDGIYSAINQEFAAHLPEQYLYLNREEDLGIPGLRQAKLSYHPVLLLEKTKAIRKP